MVPKTASEKEREKKHENAKSHYLPSKIIDFEAPLGPKTVQKWCKMRAKRPPKTTSEK